MNCFALTLLPFLCTVHALLINDKNCIVLFISTGLKGLPNPNAGPNMLFHIFHMKNVKMEQKDGKMRK